MQILEFLSIFLFVFTIALSMIWVKFFPVKKTLKDSNEERMPKDDIKKKLRMPKDFGKKKGPKPKS